MPPEILAPSSRTAYLRVRAGVGGEPIVQTIEASFATAFQPTSWGAWLIGQAAHPVGGDDLHIRFDVGVGCSAEIRSMDPMVARPGPEVGLASVCTTNITVARDAMLAWRPEPGIAGAGADHSNTSIVKLAANSRLLWADEFQIDDADGGRPGSWRSELRITRDGWPVVASELAIGPAAPLWMSPAVLGAARAVLSVAVVDPDQPADIWAYDRAGSDDGAVRGVALPLSGPGVQFIVWGPSLDGCRGVLAGLLEPAGAPPWAVHRLQAGAGVRQGSLRVLPA